MCVVARLSCTTPKANKRTSNTNRKKPKTSDWFHEQHNTQQRRGEEVGRNTHLLLPAHAGHAPESEGEKDPTTIQSMCTS